MVVKVQDFEIIEHRLLEYQDDLEAVFEAINNRIIDLEALSEPKEEDIRSLYYSIISSRQILGHKIYSIINRLRRELGAEQVD